jgi:hypothetical protein
VSDSVAPPKGETPQPSIEELRASKTSDDFLVPGPSPSSNAGTARWALTWLVFSVVLMVLMLGMSVACWLLARLVGIA